MSTDTQRQHIAQRIRELRDDIQDLDERTLIDGLILAGLAFAETYYSE